MNQRGNSARYLDIPWAASTLNFILLLGTCECFYCHFQLTQNLKAKVGQLVEDTILLRRTLSTDSEILNLKHISKRPRSTGYNWFPSFVMYRSVLRNIFSFCCAANWAETCISESQSSLKWVFQCFASSGDENFLGTATTMQSQYATFMGCQVCWEKARFWFLASSTSDSLVSSSNQIHHETCLWSNKNARSKYVPWPNRKECLLGRELRATVSIDFREYRCLSRKTVRYLQ